MVSRERWGTRTLWFDVDQEGRPKSPEWKEVDYEPRNRAWYVGVQNFPYGEVFWSEPFLFFTTKELGMTASVKWNDQGVDYVFSADILLTAITDFTRRDTTQLTKHSQTAIYTRTGGWWDCLATRSFRTRRRFAGPFSSRSVSFKFLN